MLAREPGTGEPPPAVAEKKKAPGTFRAMNIVNEWKLPVNRDEAGQGRGDPFRPLLSTGGVSTRRPGPWTRTTGMPRRRTPPAGLLRSCGAGPALGRRRSRVLACPGRSGQRKGCEQRRTRAEPNGRFMGGTSFRESLDRERANGTGEVREPASVALEAQILSRWPARRSPSSASWHNRARVPASDLPSGRLAGRRPWPAWTTWPANGELWGRAREHDRRAPRADRRWSPASTIGADEAGPHGAAGLGTGPGRLETGLPGERRAGWTSQPTVAPVRPRVMRTS
jgi:hypothetical protein